MLRTCAQQLSCMEKPLAVHAFALLNHADRRIHALPEKFCTPETSVIFVASPVTACCPLLLCCYDLQMIPDEAFECITVHKTVPDVNRGEQEASFLSALTAVQAGGNCCMGQFEKLWVA